MRPARARTRRWRPEEAHAQQRLERANALFGLRGEESRHEREKIGAENRRRLFGAKLRDRADQMHAADRFLAVMPDVIEDDKRSIRPAAQHRMDEPERPYRRVDVVGPRFRFGVAAVRLIRKAMAAQVHRDQAIRAGEIGIELPLPREAALRKAVDEQDRATARIAGFDDVELNAAAAGDGMVLHRIPPLPRDPYS